MQGTAAVLVQMAGDVIVMLVGRRPASFTGRHIFHACHIRGVQGRLWEAGAAVAPWQYQALHFAEGAWVVDTLLTVGGRKDSVSECCTSHAAQQRPSCKEFSSKQEACMRCRCIGLDPGRFHVLQLVCIVAQLFLLSLQRVVE